MIIKEARIDDRLVHGQIVTAWIQQTQAKGILVADDKAYGDPLTKTTLKMAVPKGIQLVIKTVDGAAEMLKTNDKEFPILLIVRSAKEALQLVNAGVVVDHWTLGNITGRSSGEERKMILKYVWATQTDANNIKAIQDAGVKIVAQSVPNEKVFDIVELLENAGFYK